jgi:hypothetical protein
MEAAGNRSEVDTDLGSWVSRSITDEDEESSS